MVLTVPPDLEQLIQKRLASGAFSDPEDVLRRALEAQDAIEDWSDEEKSAIAAHIETGFAQAENGDLLDGAETRQELREMKTRWFAQQNGG
jgi:Arc/MetJ-type ribon-helix-helix transcriptional regulator